MKVSRKPQPPHTPRTPHTPHTPHTPQVPRTSHSPNAPHQQANPLPATKATLMAKIIVVTSGKGGVGKTTTSASFASGLALRGHKTAVIDFDVGLRNLDLIMGCERRVVYDLINVIHGEANLNRR